MRHRRSLLPALLITAVVACGDGEPAGPRPPVVPPVPPPPDTLYFPAVAGTYEFTGTFEGPTGGTIAGTVTLVQETRARPALTGTARMSYYMVGRSALHTVVRNATVTEAGVITFELPTPLVTQRWTWTFTGSLSGGTLTGTHALTPLPFSPIMAEAGRFTARPCTAPAACGTAPAPPLQWFTQSYPNTGGYHLVRAGSLLDADGILEFGCYGRGSEVGPKPVVTLFHVSSGSFAQNNLQITARFAGEPAGSAPFVWTWGTSIHTGSDPAAALDFWSRAAAASSITLDYEQYAAGRVTRTWDTRLLAPHLTNLRALCGLPSR